MTNRQIFLDAIAADPYDLHTRKVYADWLDEYGDDRDAEEAVVQRAWTRDKQDAIVYLTAFAERLGHTDYDGYTFSISYEELISAAHNKINDKRDWYYYTLPYDTPEFVYEENDKFWKSFELATGVEVEENKKRNFFSCAC